jgi:hypothetical protein
LSPFKVLKQLIWDIVAHVETVDVAFFLPVTLTDLNDDGFMDIGSNSESYVEVRFIVEVSSLAVSAYMHTYIHIYSTYIHTYSTYIQSFQQIENHRNLQYE